MKVNCVVRVLKFRWVGLCAVCYWIRPLSALGIICVKFGFNQLNAASVLFTEMHLVTDKCVAVYS
jgi:hypothetical protein